MISVDHKMGSKYVSSSLQWDDKDPYQTMKGRISKGSSRMQSRAQTAKTDDNESCYSLPPMTARSLYIEPQFKKIDLPQMIRVNVLQPPTVPKRTVTMQTAKATDHNKKRVLKMQREQHQLTHGAWKQPIYGNLDEKENYRQNLRTCLKQQMLDYERQKKDDRLEELEYRDEVFNIDETNKMIELQKKIDRLVRGINVTKKNKELMELLEERNRMENKEIVALEKALLKIFPINPRHTLK